MGKSNKLNIKPQNNNNSLKELEQRQTDRAINTMYSLWNAIIAVNGIIIGAISILISLNSHIEKSNVFIIYILGILPIALLIWNYLSYRNLYTSLDNITFEYVEGLSDKQYKEALQKGNKKQQRRRYYVKIRERFSMFLTIGNVIYIFITIKTS